MIFSIAAIWEYGSLFPKPDNFSRNDGTFFQGADDTVGDGFSRNDKTFFFQGTDAMVGGGFAPLRELHGKGMTNDKRMDIATTNSMKINNLRIVKIFFCKMNLFN